MKNFNIDMRKTSIKITLFILLQAFLVTGLVYSFESSERINDELRSAMMFGGQGMKGRGEDLANQERPLIKLMGEEDIRVLRLGYIVELSNPEGSESYTIIKAPIDETKHPNVRFAEARDGKKAWLIFNMDAWQCQVYEKLVDKNIPGLLAGRLLKDAKGHPYFVSPHVFGKTLSELLEEKIADFKAGVITAEQLVSGVKKDAARIAYTLHSLHDMGIVYGDVHSGNIMVDENGELWLLPDFGSSSFNNREGGALKAHRETDIRSAGEIILNVLEKTNLDKQPKFGDFLAKVKRATNSDYFEKEGPYKSMVEFAKVVCDVDISDTGLASAPLLNRKARENL